jgi:hypothetical protein
MYMQIIDQIEQVEADQQAKIMEAQKGFIPSGGAKIKMDYYVASPGNPNKVERATVPAEAADWLIQRLAEQGSSQEALRNQSMGVIADISQKITGPPAYTEAPQQTQQIPPPMVSQQAGISH